VNPSSFRLRAALRVLALATIASPASPAPPAPPPPPPPAVAGSSDIAGGDSPDASQPTAADSEALNGKQIYERVLDNRFDSYIQDLTMHSGDRGGNVQDTELELKYRSFREDSKKVLSKTIMKYQAPQDVRHLGYLVINKSDGSEDQFVYRPSARRVQRINLRGEAIFGTDFAFEDIIPQELEDATYERLPDAAIGDIPVYVVEVTPVAEQDSDYSRFVVYVSLDHFVALRVVYWDRNGLKIKELTVVPESITMYESEPKGDDDMKQVWLAREQKIVHLKLHTWTRLAVQRLDPNENLKQRHFSERELTKGH
jgi:hypothetical protein